LTVSITSHHRIEDCQVLPDEQFRSSINREAFVDQQKWSLYQHVATEMRQTQEEYSFDDPQHSSERVKHSVLAITCRAGRCEGDDHCSNMSSSSSAGLLLLECVLLDISHHQLGFLYLLDSTSVCIARSYASIQH
jgi:hypothetical protein